MASTGSNSDVAAGAPYVLAVASHKGGTGRTTAAASLAWTWGSQGLRVTLLDADPVGAATLLTSDRSGTCPWPNVRLSSDLSALKEGGLTGDLIVVDCPSLTEPAAQEVLTRADGVLLTCLPDPLSLRSVPSASAAIEAARASNDRLDLLGILLPIVDEADRLQNQMLEQLRELHGGLLLEPVVPAAAEYRHWPMRPGSPPPEGPAREAYQALAQLVRGLLLRV
jgi:cellulose biosynthesis protein BcsQ